MKIIILGRLTSGFGGMETVFKKFNNLLKDDCSIEFVTLVKKITTHNLEWAENIKISILNPKTHFKRLERYSYTQQLKKKIKFDKPDFIIAYDDIGCRIAYDAIQKAKINTKLISWFHFSFHTISEKYKKFALRADYHFAICDQIKKQMIDYGIKPQSIDVIYNSTSQKSDVITASNNKITEFLYVGRIQYAEQKNLSDMFFALSRLDFDYRLNIIGGKNEFEENRLKELAIKLGISKKIKWHGWKNNPWNYVINNIKNIDSLLFTSTYEGFGMVLIEAMSYGVFCISSDCPTGPKDIINNKNGLLFKLNDIDDLLRKIKYFKEMEKPTSIEIKESINKFYDGYYKDRILNLFNNKYKS